jgi:hypothetical protein
MSDQLGADVPSETAQAWDNVRRVREPVAWALLVIAAIAILVSAWQLVGLPGNGLPAGPVAHVASRAVAPAAPVTTAPSQVAVTPGTTATTGPSPVAVTSFGWRASAVAPQFVSGGIVTLTVLAVILVVFAGGRTDRARQVVQAAVSVLAGALGFGVLSWLAALGAHSRPGVWFLFDATELAAVAAALIFAVAVLRSRALRGLRPSGGISPFERKAM